VWQVAHPGTEVITTENLDEDSKPTLGKIDRVRLQTSNSVWDYFTVGNNSGIHEFTDSQFGRLFAVGPNRDDGRKWKQNAGTCPVVKSDAFFRGHKNFKDAMAKLEEFLKKGQTGVAEITGINKFAEEITHNCKYMFEITHSSPDSYTMTINCKATEIKYREQPDGSIILTSFCSAVRQVTNVFDPSELRSDVTCKGVRFFTEEGGSVKASQSYVECEAMKMIKASQAGSILTTGDMIASLELADPSKVVNIDIESDPLDQRPMHSLNLALKGFPSDTESQLSRAFLDVSGEQASDNCALLIDTFCDTEDKFKDKALDLAVLDLINANTASTTPVMEAVQAHSALKSRSALMIVVLRNINSSVDHFPGYAVLALGNKALERLAALLGAAYGEVSTFSAAILNDFRSPDFTSRLAELKALITSDNLENGCKLSKLAVNVDFLSHFWTNTDEKIRNAALEAFLRRGYRMHTISDVTITKTDGVVSAKWQYQCRDLPSNEAELRIGMLTVLDSAAAAAAQVPKALADFKAHVKGQPDVKGQPATSGELKDRAVLDKDAKNGKIVFKHNKDMLNELRVRHVSCIVTQVSKSPRYFTCLSCHYFDEDVLRHDMSASFPYILELPVLQGNYDLTRISSLGRNAQLWIGTENPNDNMAVTRPRPQPVTVFLRALSHSMDSSSPAGVERLMVDAMEKIKTPYPVQCAAYTRIFLYGLNDYEEDTQSLIKGFKGILDGLLAKYSTCFLELRVDELRVKARISYVADGKKHMQPVHLVASSTWGDWFKSDAYLDDPKPVTGVIKQFRTLEENKTSVMQILPYPTVLMKLLTAHCVGSTRSMRDNSTITVGFCWDCRYHGALAHAMTVLGQRHATATQGLIHLLGSHVSVMNFSSLLFLSFWSSLLVVWIILTLLPYELPIWLERMRMKNMSKQQKLEPRLPVVALSLLLLCHLNVADAAKNRGWLLDTQLVRGTRPLTRSGYGIAVIADLYVIFGGDVQGSKYLRAQLNILYVCFAERLPATRRAARKSPLTCVGDTSLRCCRPGK
jgi:acetyl-CoA carboxylase/biotin carboxylase 1